MTVEYYYPHWGSTEKNPEDFFRKVKSAGFAGVEIPILEDLEQKSGLIIGLCKKYGLKLIAQQWMPCTRQTVDEYLEQFEVKIRSLASFHPRFINSHSGRDYFEFEENCRVFEMAANLSRELNIPIYHETHRGRALYSPASARKYFAAFADLGIAADFSHWCVVSESLLEDQTEFMSEAITRSFHIHARVGSAQSPQVNHPASEENRNEVEIHLNWWQSIIDCRKKEGREAFTVTTEFGPVPYLPVLPFTGQPVADQWEINLYMKDLLNKHLDSSQISPGTGRAYPAGPEI